MAHKVRQLLKLCKVESRVKIWKCSFQLGSKLLVDLWVIDNMIRCHRHPITRCICSSRKNPICFVLDIVYGWYDIALLWDRRQNAMKYGLPSILLGQACIKVSFDF